MQCRHPEKTGGDRGYVFNLSATHLHMNPVRSEAFIWRSDPRRIINGHWKAFPAFNGTNCCGCCLTVVTLAICLWLMMKFNYLYQPFYILFIKLSILKNPFFHQQFALANSRFTTSISILLSFTWLWGTCGCVNVKDAGSSSARQQKRRAGSRVKQQHLCAPVTRR